MDSCIFVSGDFIKETLKDKVSQGKRLLEPLKSFAAQHRLPLNILEDHQVSNEAEVHRHEADLWYCLEGEVEFIYGGKMVNPWAKEGNDKEIKAKEITGGERVVMKPGDWLYIPAGQPHQHQTGGTARLVIIKVPAKQEVSLEAVPGWKN